MTGNEFEDLSVVGMRFLLETMRECEEALQVPPPGREAACDRVVRDFYARFKPISPQFEKALEYFQVCEERKGRAK